MQLQNELESFDNAKIQIVGVSFDSVEKLKSFSDARKLEFPLLSDAGSKIIKEYGLHYMKGLPHPGTVIVDSQGVVRAKLFHQGYRKRHTAEEILTAVKELKSE